ncbi:MAG: alanine racemase, partial [Candidatus Eremiobacteraeota bacterium]|nr:alanine racemase [Candidatus Eremiobacteraeota bacterium]
MGRGLRIRRGAIVAAERAAVDVRHRVRHRRDARDATGRGRGEHLYASEHVLARQLVRRAHAVLRHPGRRDRRGTNARAVAVRCELTIDLGAIRTNVTRLAALAGPAAYAAVIKANAYGHGLVPVARALENSGAAFCGNRADEA